MDKKLVGAIGAIAGLATLDTAAQATPAAAPVQPAGANSFAELLDPISKVVIARQSANDAKLLALSAEARARANSYSAAELVRRIRSFFSLDA